MTENSGKVNEIKFSTGVVLTAKQVSTMMMTKMLRSFGGEPTPPTVFDKDRGENISNPDDPKFKKEHSEWQLTIGDLMTDRMIVLGTSLKSSPKDFQKIDDKEWREELEVLEMSVGEGKERYLNWVKYVAAPTGEDITSIVNIVGGLSGIPETEVDASVQSFRSDEE